MKEAWNFDNCVSVLTGEINLLKKISSMQSQMRQATMGRQWDDFENKTLEIDQAGEEFVRLENKRTRLFSALSNLSQESADSARSALHSADSDSDEGSASPWVIEEKPFYRAILALPVDERRKLSDLYRELKIETLKMRALNETFLAYLTEAKTMTAAYIEAVCPDRGGKLYTRKGRRVSQDLKSIVFNNRF